MHQPLCIHKDFSQNINAESLLINKFFYSFSHRKHCARTLNREKTWSNRILSDKIEQVTWKFGVLCRLWWLWLFINLKLSKVLSQFTLITSISCLYNSLSALAKTFEKNILSRATVSELRATLLVVFVRSSWMEVFFEAVVGNKKKI